MRNKITLVVVFFYLFFQQICNAQNENFGIQMRQPYKLEAKNCKQCKLAFGSMAKEIKFSIIRENSQLFFQVNDKEWFNQLFKNENDGIAIDIVNRYRYDCGTVVNEYDQLRGLLLKPVYANQLKSGLRAARLQGYKVLVGTIPEELRTAELEFNILFIGNKTLCRYQTIYNLQAYPWDLLDMGMYLDTISYANNKIGEPIDGFKMKNKILRFQIPFQKNKATYEKADMKSLYDSLKLTDFNIKSISIKAYASVEGSAERNAQLQNQRANSIVEALQSYQKPTIKTTVSTAENWVEFYNDIEGTEFESLKELTKSEVKTSLNASIVEYMEPILRHHRKAVVELDLIKKDYYESVKNDELVQAFNLSIKAQDDVEASRLQNSLFNRLKYFEVSPTILDALEIPEQLNYVRYLNNRSAYRYQLDESRILISMNELEQLQKLDPDNKRVNYNLVAMKFKMWRFKMLAIDRAEFLKEIKDLERFGVEENLIQRMLINFHIIKCERDLQNKDYESKDESVEYIYDSYKFIKLSDLDYFSLAQFLSYYANTEWAAELLSDKVQAIDVDENLLFYYLNLTLVNTTLTKTDAYRTIMLNASIMNQKRYCRLFDAVEKGGVTFQLLEDIYLRKGYCELCQ